MKTPLPDVSGIFSAFILMLCIQTSQAGSATWKRNPRSGDWNTKTNWRPATVPNGSADTATFALSNTTAISISANTELNGITFTAAATNPYTITASPGFTLTLSGTGITNNSGIAQNFVTDGKEFGQIRFTNNATAGNSTTFTNKGASMGGTQGGSVGFQNFSTAGHAFLTNDAGMTPGAPNAGGRTFFTGVSTAASATITNIGATEDGAFGGFVRFFDASSASSATITNNGGGSDGSFGGRPFNGGLTEFFGSSTAGSATITNNSGTSFGADGGSTAFFGTSTAGNAMITNNGVSAAVISAAGGSTVFNDSSSAGSATITNTSVSGAFGGGSGFTEFNNSSTAASATIINNGGAVDRFQLGALTEFNDTSTAGAATITNNGATVSSNGRPNGGETEFDDFSTAGDAMITNNGGKVGAFGGGFTEFTNSSTADSSTINNNGATVSGAHGGTTVFSGFFGTCTAGNATIINNGSTVSGAGGGATVFESFINSFLKGSSTADLATLIANGGTNGGQGGRISFEGTSTGGASRVEVFGNGELDISPHGRLGSMTVGSIEGDGNVFLGANNLTIGSNKLSTTFSGVMQDGGQNGGTGGSLTKIGSGTLDLTGANTYTGDTKIQGGVLQVDGSITSNTFLGGRGTLAGRGTVHGNVTNNGGTVSPGDAPGTLTVNNNYTQGSTGRLLIDIAGPNTREFSVLDVLGNANLDGILHPVLLNGFIPAVGESFTFLDYTTLTGTFSSIETQPVDHLIEQWSVTYHATYATLTATGAISAPDQGSTYLLLTLSLLGVVTYRHGLLRKQA